MRHFFGVSEDECGTWTVGRWNRYKATAEHLIKAGR